MRIAIIGGGGWGLALAKLLYENNNEILLWEYNGDFLEKLIKTHSNPQLLPDIILPSEIAFTGDFYQLARFHPEIIILAVPTQFIRSTLQSIPREVQKELWNPDRLLAIVNVAKGIEEHTLLTVSGILNQIIPSEVHNRICTLSGPSHAEEVARQIPTTVVIAGSETETLKKLQLIFSNSYFRVYRSTDLKGVEMGGAVKNVIAIAAGIIAGLEYGDNTIGALLTRGLVEIQRLGVACGARSETFLGLSGLGDLVTTATSQHSRNRYVGFQIGQGEKLQDIVQSMAMIAEGVATTRSVYNLATQKNVEMPITEQVYQVLFLNKNPRKAILELMTRDLKEE